MGCPCPQACPVGGGGPAGLSVCVHTRLFLCLYWKPSSQGNLSPARRHRVLANVPLPRAAFLCDSEKSGSRCPDASDDVAPFDPSPPPMGGQSAVCPVLASPRGHPPGSAECCYPEGAPLTRDPIPAETPSQLLWVTPDLPFAPPPTLPKPGSAPHGGFHIGFFFPPAVFALPSQ